MANLPKAILFDLDGTLIDSAPDIAHALAHAFDSLEMNTFSDSKVRQWIGNGVDRLIHRALTNSMEGIAEPELFNQVRSLFFTEYKKNIGVHSKLYPEVLETLKLFTHQNILLGCITNKDRVFTLPLLETLGIKQYFKIIIGGDDVENKKPAADPLLHAAKELNVSINQCLMIGDSKTDIAAANNAKMDIICVDYGYSQGEDLSQFNIKALISNFNEIEALLIKNS